MPNNEYSSENENELRYYTVKILHQFFYNKRDLLPDNVTVSNANLQAGLLRDKNSIRINKNQIDDLNTIAPSSHTHGQLQTDGSIKKANTSGNLIAQPNANVITDANGFLTTEEKISTVSPNNDPNTIKSDSFSSASAGQSSLYARADHIHKQEHDSTKSDVGHKHNTGDINNLASTITSTMSSHTHGIIKNNGTVGTDVGSKSKNVVTDSTGAIALEDKPSIPQASTITPPADTTSGTVGTGTTWARSNHSHPKSTLYASAQHKHAPADIEQTVNGTTKNLNTLLSEKANTNHSHGIIQSDGKVVNSSYPINQNKNIITDSNGKIVLEDRIAPTDFTNLQNKVDKFSWVNVLTDYAYIDGINSSTSIITNSNVQTFYMNEGLRICFIRFSVPLPSTVNKWIDFITLPSKFGPIWTQYLIPHHVGHLVRVVDDDGIGSNQTDKRKVQYLVRKEAPVVEDVTANGFFFYSQE